MRLCIDCKHHKEIGLSDEHVCGNELCGSYLDPVDGLRVYRKCSHARASLTSCGTEGKLWEPRE